MLFGVGGHAVTFQSKDLIHVRGPENWVANIHPFILETPITSWGRDCMARWGTQIGSNLS